VLKTWLLAQWFCFIMNLSREEKLEQLERVVRSQAFHESESLRSFLSFIVNKFIDGEEDQIKEYTIATDVFGRGKQFNPRIDSVVRVQAGRLRYKLHEYYSTEGKGDRILIELPKGHYKPVFSYIETSNGAHPEETRIEESPKLASESSLAPGVDTIAPSPGKEKLLLLVLSAAVVILAISTTILFIANQKASTAAAENSAGKLEEVYKEVWGDFFRDSDPPLVVIGNPTIYRLANPMDPYTGDARTILLKPEQTNELARAIGKEKFILNSIRNKSAPRLLLSTDEYTGIGEAIGLHNVTNLMRGSGKTVVLKQSRTASGEDLKNHNAILLGSIWVNEWTGKQPVKESFVYTDNATIQNLEPQTDEEQEYKPRFNPVSGKLVEDYALITVKPSISGKSTMMILAGIYSEGTQAAAEFATSKDYLVTLNQRLQQLFGNQQTPKYYQALLKVTVDNGIPTLISLVAVHRLQTEN
jgi:hypothetical protein